MSALLRLPKTINQVRQPAQSVAPKAASKGAAKAPSTTQSHPNDKMAAGFKSPTTSPVVRGMKGVI